MKTRFFILLLVFVTSFPIMAQNNKAKKKSVPTTSRSNSKTYELEADGFEWYRVSKAGKFGALDKSETVLIPTEYNKLVYCNHEEETLKGFLVKLGSYAGFYSKQGKPIIPYKRGYLSIEIKRNGDSIDYFYCKKEKGVAFCDVNGKELYTITSDLECEPQYTLGRLVHHVWNKQKQYGLADGEGKIFIQPQYSSKLYIDNNGYIRTIERASALGDVNTVKLSNNPFSSFDFDGNNSHASTPTNTNKKRVKKTKIERTWVNCEACGGSRRCPNCGGRGYRSFLMNNQAYEVTCFYNNCWNGKCGICKGDGGHYEDKTITYYDYE